jgi:hypothetical protein
MVSVSSDTRYIAVAGKLGFAHLSTSSGRWRALESMEGISSGLNDLEQIPHVRGGMCWYGGVLLVGADFGDSHEVYLPNLWSDLDPIIPSQRCIDGTEIIPSPRNIHHFNSIDVSPGRFVTCVLSR